MIRVASDEALSLDAVLNVLDEVTRELKKARSQSLDLSTAVHVLRDRAKQRQTVEATT